MITEIIALGLT